MTAKTKRTAASTKYVEGAATVGQEAVDNFVKVGTESYEKAFVEAQNRMQEAMKQYDDLASFGQATLQAFVASGTACVKGYEQLTAEWMAFGKQSMEDSVAAARAAMTAKSLQDLMDLQTSFARSSLDAMVAQGTRISELATKVAQETAEPLNERFNAAVDTFAKKAA
jgi:phasin family protein